jgi:hypothetical protein
LILIRELGGFVIVSECCCVKNIVNLGLQWKTTMILFMLILVVLIPLLVMGLILNCMMTRMRAVKYLMGMKVQRMGIMLIMTMMMEMLEMIDM